MPKRKASDSISFSRQVHQAIVTARRQFGAAAWQTADRIISERLPMLPKDLAVLIGRTEPLPPELWRLVSDYAASSDDVPRKLILQRINCLFFTGGSTDDAFLLAEPSIRTVTTTELPYWYSLTFRLFSLQKYAACERLSARFLANLPNRLLQWPPRSVGHFPDINHPSEWSLFRSLSLSFLGRFDEAEKQLQDLPYQRCHAIRRLYGWNDFAKSIANRRTDGFRFLLQKLQHRDLVGSLSVSFLLAMLKTILTEPSIVTADWLQSKHSETVRHVGAGFVDRMTTALL